MVMQSRKYRLCRCLGYNINSCIRADIQLAVPAYKAALKVIMACFRLPSINSRTSLLQLSALTIKNFPAQPQLKALSKRPWRFQCRLPL